MRKRSIEQTAQATWAASDTISTDLEKIGLITRIDFEVEITPSASMATANQPDGLFRVLQNVRIEGSPHVYTTLPADPGGHSGTLLHYLNRLDGFGVGHIETAAIAAPQETHNPIRFTFHFGSRPKLWNGVDNPFDLSAFIPAGAETQLTASWITTPNSVMDDTVTIDSAVGKFTLHRVTGSEGEIRQEMSNQGVVLPTDPRGSRPTGMIPAWSSRIKAHTATTSDYEDETDDLPTGGFLKRVAILNQDGTATRPARAANQITSIRIWSEKTSETLYQVSLSLLQGYLPLATVTTADSAAGAFNGGAPNGIGVIDLRALSTGTAQPHQVGADYGWDLRRSAGLEKGDLRLGYIISTQGSGDDRLLHFDRLQTYDEPLGKAARGG